MTHNKNLLIKQLQEMGFNELVETIHTVLESRNDRRLDPETKLPDSELFLLSRVYYDATEDHVLSYFCGVGTSLELNDEGPGYTGRCGRCKVLVTSSCKRANCPVCGLADVGLT